MKKINLRYTCALILGDKLFFSGANINGLFQMNLDNFSVQYITSFQGYPVEGYGCLHLSIVPYENKLFFFPLNGKTIHSYELGTGLQQSVEIPMKIGEDVPDKFYGCYVIVRGRKAWLFSRELHRGIYEFDMADYSIKKSKKLSERMLKYSKITNFVETSDMRVFTYSVDANVLIEIDVEKETVEEHILGVRDIDIISINYFLGKFWFVGGESGDIYEWNKQDQSIKRYVAEGVEWIDSEGYPFGGCCLVEGEIYVLPGKSKHIMKLNRELRKITKVGEYPKDFCFLDDWEIGAFSKYDVVGDVLWLHPWKGNRLLLYNTKTGIIESKEISFELYKIRDKNMPFQNGIVQESALLSLEYLCQAEWKRELHKGRAETEQIGKKIYESVSRLEEIGNE